MGRRRKTRTHLKAPTAGQSTTGSDAPKSFIVKHGQVGHSITQLVRDMRQVMEPNTAARLRERSRNKLKDYLAIAPALKVSHLLAFTLTPIAPSLRLVRLSAGPTFSFRIERYSLSKDIVNASRHPRSVGVEYLSPPLLVLASFPSPSTTTPPHLLLLMRALQSLFPPLSPKNISLPSARRVVLVSYNEANDILEFRHYLITVRPYGVSRRVRRVIDASAGKKKAGLDLSNHEDVADFLLRTHTSGYESASSAGEEDSDNAVSLPTDYVGRNNKKGDRRAVRLDEIGPRMELRLVKIVEGVPGKQGAVLYHKFVTKSRAQEAKQQAEHATKERLRKQRREEQEQNVKRKKMAAQKGNAGYVNITEVQEIETEEGDENDEGTWDDDEEFSEGEESRAGTETSESSESDGEQRSLPSKRQKGSQPDL